MSRSFDVVIAGDGILGWMTAWRLKQDDAGLTIAVIAPTRQRGGASRASGAMLGTFGEVTAATLASAPGREKFALARLAHERWPDLLRQLAELTDIHHVEGTFVVLNGRSGQLDSDNFRALTEALDEYAEPYEFCDVVPGLNSVPDARPLRALHLPGEGAVDSAGVLGALRADAERRGVVRIDAAVHQVDVQGGRVRAAELDSGERVDAGAAVLALGAFSSPVLRRTLGPSAVQPVLAGAGLAYLSQRVMGPGFTEVVRSVNRAGSCGLHVVPLGNREYYGATNVIFAEPEERPHLGVLHFVADCVMDQLDQLACYSRIDEIRVGNRPVSLDTFPLLGATSVSGLVVITGTYRDGFHCSPVIAEWTSRLVRGIGDDFPAAFAPERSAYFTLSRKEAVEQYAEQAMASAFEARTMLSPFIASQELLELYRPKAERVHDAVGLASLGLAPDIVGYLALSRKSPSDVDAVAAYLAATGVAA